MMASGIAITVYISLNTLRELFQIYQQKWQYLLEPNNLVSWLLYTSAAVMISPIFNGGYVIDAHFSAASITVFLSWFNLLLFLQRFDQVCGTSKPCVCVCACVDCTETCKISLLSFIQIGIYVVMFLEILQTLIKVLMVFSILIIAFGLAFYILMSKVSQLGCQFD